MPRSSTATLTPGGSRSGYVEHGVILCAAGLLDGHAVRGGWERCRDVEALPEIRVAAAPSDRPLDDRPASLRSELHRRRGLEPDSADLDRAVVAVAEEQLALPDMYTPRRIQESQIGSGPIDLVTKRADLLGQALEDLRTITFDQDVDLHLAQGSQPLQTPHASMRQTEQIDGTIKEAASVPASGLRLSSTSSAPAQWDVLPLKGLRRATAMRMASVRQIPAGCAIVEADVTVLDEFYRKERDAWLAREGFPLTYTPFFLYSLAQSLRYWPVVRQALRNGQRETRDGIHVGIAVALDDGLIVPVIRSADQLDLPGLISAQADLVVRARAHRLQPEDVTGGIATLTNVGSMGGLLALPMLNENQAVMLGVGAVTRRTVGTSDGILYRSCAYLSLTFDRRLLDDLQAERFLLDIARRVTQASWREEQAEIRS